MQLSSCWKKQGEKKKEGKVRGCEQGYLFILHKELQVICFLGHEHISAMKLLSRLFGYYAANVSLNEKQGAVTSFKKASGIPYSF